MKVDGEQIQQWGTPIRLIGAVLVAISIALNWYGGNLAENSQFFITRKKFLRALKSSQDLTAYFPNVFALEFSNSDYDFIASQIEHYLASYTDETVAQNIYDLLLRSFPAQTLTDARLDWLTARFYAPSVVKLGTETTHSFISRVFERLMSNSNPADIMVLRKIIWSYESWGPPDAGCSEPYNLVEFLAAKYNDDKSRDVLRRALTDDVLDAQLPYCGTSLSFNIPSNCVGWFLADLKTQVPAIAD